MSYDINTVADEVISAVAGLGAADDVVYGEPLAAPAGRAVVAVIPLSGQTQPEQSGLASSSMSVTFMARIYTPVSDYEADMGRFQWDVAGEIVGALHANLGFDKADLEVDVMGFTGTRLTWQAGVVSFDDARYRVIDINFAVLDRDAYTQTI